MTIISAPAIVHAHALSESIKVEQLTCAIGAEVSGVHLGVASRDPALVAELRKLLVQHKVLFFRDQNITRAEHAAFARYFGDLAEHPYAPSADTPGVQCIYKSPENPPLGTDRLESTWHSDTTWRAIPPFGAMLRCIECPPVGGDTMWANMVLAYAGLPEHIKKQIANLRANHSLQSSFGAALPIEKRLELKAKYPDAEHPVVRTHPDTGEKILFVSGYATHFTNYNTKENFHHGIDSAPGASNLLQYLISRAFIPEYQVRFRWKANSVALWDNRSTQHCAVMDYPPSHRKMERTEIIGEAVY